MKKIIKAVLGTAAIFSMVYLVSAFTYTEKPKQRIQQTFEPWNFVGAPNPNDDDPTDSSQYEEGTGTEPCPGSEEVCQIQAPRNPVTGEPDLGAYIDDEETTTVLDQIADALQNGPNEHVSMRDTP